MDTPWDDNDENYLENKSELLSLWSAHKKERSWGTILYYEFNSRVGEAFLCRSPEMIVDGFTNPTGPNSDRFCLGQLSNVNRNSTIENTRKHIGKGVGLHYYGNGDLYAECLSDSAIFVESPICDVGHRMYSSAMYEIPPGCSMKIFSDGEFCDLLLRSMIDGYEAVYKMRKMVTIRLSFVKGWGAEYHGQDITSMPCWIEIHLRLPFVWLYNMLTNGMEALRGAISSVVPRSRRPSWRTRTYRIHDIHYHY